VTFKVVIPARMASQRLPGKPLLDIAGKPMIQRVVEQAAASGAAEVWVATDDERVVAVVRNPRYPACGIAVMTDPALPSGTDRVAAVARLRGWSDATIVVNVQGDEPFLPPSLIDQVAAALVSDPRAAIATLATPVACLDEFLDPNIVKVARSDDGSGIYFSRAPIPWSRDGASDGISSQRRFEHALRHLGIYAYRVGALQHLTALSPSPLERCEKLEQLRALEAGMRITVAVSVVTPPPGVDTEDDLLRARAWATRRQGESV
jgi:3-deoxy-manno-octulosonate cytidylyltransferase (CMP-KDO synthetase)